MGSQIAKPATTHSPTPCQADARHTNPNGQAQPKPPKVKVGPLSSMINHSELCVQKFANKWLESPTDVADVIDMKYWNVQKVAAIPNADGQYSVAGHMFGGTYFLTKSDSQPFSLISIFLEEFYGISACIIPVGFLLELEGHVFAFTVRGPLDESGGKPFYILNFPIFPEQAELHLYTRSFTSIPDFRARHLDTPLRTLKPLPDAVHRIFAACDKLGSRMSWCRQDTRRVQFSTVHGSAGFSRVSEWDLNPPRSWPRVDVGTMMKRISSSFPPSPPSRAA